MKRRVKSKAAAPFNVPIEALNYDAPSFAICGDIRADGGLLPVLNDPVPMARQPLTRRTRAFKHDPLKHTIAGEMGPVPRDTEPLMRVNSPGKSGAPWTTTRPRDELFHAAPYIEEGPTDRRAALRDAPPSGRLGGDFKSGKGPEIFMRYEHIPGQGRTPTPRKPSALKAGRGPGMFDMFGLSGPSLALVDERKLPRRMRDGPRNIQIGPTRDTFGAYPEYIGTPYDDNHGLKDEKAGGGMYVCVPTSKATVPIMNVWSAPHAQAAAPVKRDPASGLTRYLKGMGPRHGAPPAGGLVPARRGELDASHTGTLMGGTTGRLTQKSTAPPTYRPGVLVGSADGAVGTWGAAGMVGSRTPAGGTTPGAAVGTYPAVGGMGRAVHRAPAATPSGMGGGGHLPPIPANTFRD